ncbi:MAG: hypothetical protein ABEJ66_01825 [Candidatus Nanohaloarchaea archaeon]
MTSGIAWYPIAVAVIGGFLGGLLKALEDGKFTAPDFSGDAYGLGESNLVVQGIVYGLVYLAGVHAGFFPAVGGLWGVGLGSGVAGYLGLNISKFSGLLKRT